MAGLWKKGALKTRRVWNAAGEEPQASLTCRLPIDPAPRGACPATGEEAEELCCFLPPASVRSSG